MERNTMMSDDEEDFDDNQSLVELVAENMAVYASAVSDYESFMPQAEQLLRSFEAIEGRPATNYLEVEEWSRRHLNKVGPARYLVLPGK
jgi:hypothetical protein